MNHGDYDDASAWIQSVTDNGEGALPYHLQLAEYGYDMWFSNNRGTWYSQDHVSLDAANDPEYWLYTWADMGLYDDVANIKAIKEAT